MNNKRIKFIRFTMEIQFSYKFNGMYNFYALVVHAVSHCRSRRSHTFFTACKKKRMDSRGGARSRERLSAENSRTRATMSGERLSRAHRSRSLFSSTKTKFHREFYPALLSASNISFYRFYSKLYHVRWYTVIPPMRNCRGTIERPPLRSAVLSS